MPGLLTDWRVASAVAPNTAQAARSFNGTSDRIVIGAIPAFQAPVFPFFVGAWVRMTDVTNHHAVLSTLNATTAGWIVKATFSGGPGNMGLTQGTGGGFIDTSAGNVSTPPLNRWIYMGWSVGSSSVTFYELDRSLTIVTASIGATPTSTAQTWIGGSNFGAGSDFMQGNLAHVLYVNNFNVTISRFLALANGSWDRFTFGGGTLEGYWPLGGSVPEFDLSGKMRHGTLTGTGLAGAAPVQLPQGPRGQWFVTQPVAAPTVGLQTPIIHQPPIFIQTW